MVDNRSRNVTASVTGPDRPQVKIHIFRIGKELFVKKTKLVKKCLVVERRPGTCPKHLPL